MMLPRFRWWTLLPATAATAALIAFSATPAQARPSCLDPTKAVEKFESEFPDLGDADACDFACAQWTKSCRRVGAAARRCQQTIMTHEATVVKAACRTLADRSERLDCLSERKADFQASRQALKVDGADALLECDDQLSACVAACDP